MSSGLREKLVILGGGVSLAALICGLLLLLRPPSSGASPTPEAAHEASGTKAAHGKETPKSTHGKEAPKAKSAPAHGSTGEKPGPATHEAKSGHGAAAEEKPVAANAHGNGGAETAGTTEPKPHRDVDPAVEAEMYRTKGDSAAACGRYDDAARYYVLAIQNVPQERKAEYELRLADATRLSPSLPAQLRAQKAAELYSRVLAEDPKPNVAEEAQFQMGECLAAQRRWQEALDAFNRYQKKFPVGTHQDQVRYRRAEALAILGNPDQAGEILDQLVKDEQDPERKSRAILLLARVKLQMVRTDSFAPAQDLPATHLQEIKERPVSEGNQTQESESSKPLIRKEALTPAPKGIPETQWAVIKRHVEGSNFKEALRLVRPYIENNPDQTQSALMWSHWARLLRETAERGALDRQMTGVMISSRAE